MASAQSWRSAAQLPTGAPRHGHGATVASSDEEEAQEKYRNSIAAYRKFQGLVGATADSSNVQVFYEIATALSRLGGHEEAIANYEEVLNVGVVPNDIYFTMGKAYSGLQEWDKAISHYLKHRKWVSEQEEDYAPVTGDAELDRRIGESLYNNKDYVSAIPYLVKARLEIDPSRPDAGPSGSTGVVASVPGPTPKLRLCR